MRPWHVASRGCRTRNQKPPYGSQHWYEEWWRELKVTAKTYFLLLSSLRWHPTLYFFLPIRWSIFLPLSIIDLMVLISSVFLECVVSNFLHYFFLQRMTSISYDLLFSNKRPPCFLFYLSNSRFCTFCIRRETSTAFSSSQSPVNDKIICDLASQMSTPKEVNQLTLSEIEIP